MESARSLYKNGVDFAALSLQSPEFAKQWVLWTWRRYWNWWCSSLKSNGQLDFNDPASVRYNKLTELDVVRVDKATGPWLLLCWSMTFVWKLNYQKIDYAHRCVLGFLVAWGWSLMVIQVPNRYAKYLTVYFNVMLTIQIELHPLVARAPGFNSRHNQRRIWFWTGGHRSWYVCHHSASFQPDN